MERPLPPLPLSVLHFTGIQSYSYTDQRKVEADVEVTEDRTGTSRSESRALANCATTAPSKQQVLLTSPINKSY